MRNANLMPPLPKEASVWPTPLPEHVSKRLFA
nr:MAG TPA: hypothetical protein [Caudoviricetes sp.]